MARQSIQTLFAQVPETYEIINHMLTFGFDDYWRRQAARLAAVQGGTHWLDICTGTGETAFYLQRRAGPRTAIYGIDFSEPMLRTAMKKQRSDLILFGLADAGQLPFPDASFDVITISFATRNIHKDRRSLITFFDEFRRVLKPSGLFINLETSQPGHPLIRMMFHLYIRLFVKRIGGWISGSLPAYAYLAHTLPRFYPAETLLAIIKESGFSKSGYRSFLFGIAALHWGRK